MEKPLHEHVELSHQAIAETISNLFGKHQKVMEKMNDHLETFPERRHQVEKALSDVRTLLEEHAKAEEVELTNIKLALYGNDMVGHEGLIKQVSEIHEMFINPVKAASRIGKFFIFIAAVGSAILLLKNFK